MTRPTTEQCSKWLRTMLEGFQAARSTSKPETPAARAWANNHERANVEAIRRVEAHPKLVYLARMVAQQVACTCTNESESEMCDACVNRYHAKHLISRIDATGETLSPGEGRE